MDLIDGIRYLSSGPFSCKSFSSSISQSGNLSSRATQKKFGWIVYALCLPALIISILLLLSGKSWSFWLGGFIFVVWAFYGYWIDYVKRINWRKPIRMDIMVPYLILYLSTIMFYWWPVALLHKPLWYVFGVLFMIGSVLNIKSH